MKKRAIELFTGDVWMSAVSVRERKMISMDTQEIKALNRETLRKYIAFRERGLDLNMARGKPCVEQLDLALGVLEALHARSEFRQTILSWATTPACR